MTPGIYGKKKFCTYWIRTGNCDYVQEGCIYLHVIPDEETRLRIGIRDMPRWAREDFPASQQPTYPKQSVALTQNWRNPRADQAAKSSNNSRRQHPNGNTPTPSAQQTEIASKQQHPSNRGPSGSHSNGVYQQKPLNDKPTGSPASHFAASTASMSTQHFPQTLQASVSPSVGNSFRTLQPTSSPAQSSNDTLKFLVSGSQPDNAAPNGANGSQIGSLPAVNGFVDRNVSSRGAQIRDNFNTGYANGSLGITQKGTPAANLNEQLPQLNRVLTPLPKTLDPVAKPFISNSSTAGLQRLTSDHANGSLSPSLQDLHLGTNQAPAGYNTPDTVYHRRRFGPVGEPQFLTTSIEEEKAREEKVREKKHANGGHRKHASGVRGSTNKSAPSTEQQ